MVLSGNLLQWCHPEHPRRPRGIPLYRNASVAGKGCLEAHARSGAWVEALLFRSRAPVRDRWRSGASGLLYRSCATDPSPRRQARWSAARRWHPSATRPAPRAATASSSVNRCLADRPTGSCCSMSLSRSVCSWSLPAGQWFHLRLHARLELGRNARYSEISVTDFKNDLATRVPRAVQVPGFFRCRERQALLNVDAELPVIGQSCSRPPGTLRSLDL